MKKTRVLVTGGGTGGHMYPIVSVAVELQTEALRNNIPLRVRYIGAAEKKYRDILADNGVEVRRILGGKFRRYFALANFVDIPKIAVSMIQALWKLFFFMPDAVFSKGGPGSAPVVLAARFYRIPVVVHESDSVPSITSKFTGRFAKIIATSFESTSRYFEGLGARVILTGNPVRTSLLKNKLAQSKAKAFLEFDEELPLILILGGSQGATFMNDFVLDNLKELLPITQIFHQTGAINYETVGREFAVMGDELPPELAKRYKAIDYFDNDISIAYTACDLVVSRPGAGGIFEIAAFEKPSILIPITNSANNHQMFNAIEYSKTGAALVFEEQNLLPHLFLERIKELFSDPNRLIEMSKATAQFYRPDAALKLAQILLTINEQ
ncbi:MAG: hypothetical protein A3I33_03115 [Candidatus Colwellbacteria bacterium RIFCSPLOWO2_02_FULL_45_11]|uniref:UDP-N-acetylglucosamine--N-acetylmuramyl-(pentapeptide) pyrophosphoryl-undecaprenol N-acetylglucosamine transferase n=1 Tax=Candidatus Colwellbacteria bacterium RIFCSPLOWO2_02_FULL_45_11 TaxID=1797692 RepID=A0A1G1Z940_9BACT|nr:MAG: hypothetical protein A3I33_03115 [Candidatus Colwellbacteria bacterium RIFCSPLOWO2_02_FULL_45_11]